MDSGPDGRITRSVHCRTAGKPGTFSCLLQSTRSTSLGARVVAGDGGLAESWEPLRG
jgi:hypothetical protein